MLCCSMRDDLQNKVGIFVLHRGDRRLRLGADREAAVDLEFRLACEHGEGLGRIKYPRHLSEPGRGEQTGT